MPMPTDEQLPKPGFGRNTLCTWVGSTGQIADACWLFNDFQVCHGNQSHWWYWMSIRANKHRQTLLMHYQMTRFGNNIISVIFQPQGFEVYIDSSGAVVWLFWIWIAIKDQCLDLTERPSWGASWVGIYQWKCSEETPSYGVFDMQGLQLPL